MKKKIIICIVVALTMLFSMCGCKIVKYTEVDRHANVQTEVKGDLQTTYVYHCYECDDLVSKTVYNTATKITTEYTYFYENRGWGRQPNGVNIITIQEDGTIIDSHKE